VATIVFMLSPMVLVMLFSFGRNDLASFPMKGLTLRWYEALFANKDFWTALENSTIICLSVGAASVVVGTLAAFVLARERERVAIPLLGILSMPLMLPPLVLGLALLSAYSALGLGLGLLTVIPGQLVFIQPFVILIVYARMAAFDYAVVDSARDLGASPLRAFLTVTLPIVRPTLIGAAMIGTALSLDEFIITYYTIGGGLTLPTLVWGMLRTSLDPDINALATIIIAVTVGSTMIALRLTRYR
jgi:spermidine/putrescine transport system permease protein